MTDNDLLHSAIQYLRGLQAAGITDLPADAKSTLDSLIDQARPETSATVVAEPSATYETTTPAASPDSGAPTKSAGLGVGGTDDAYGAKLDDPGRINALKVLNQQVAGCTKCPELSSCRTQTVFGVGNPSPRLAFFGEGPGADEDRLGEPFVGRAGELLNKIIAACKLAREDVYIFNSVKCRPPGNRNPHEGELENCQEFWTAQLEILQPEFICCLGSVAAKTLLQTKDSVARMRGKFHDYRGSKVVVTYHPAYLLRTPEAKAKTWDDMKMLMVAMGVSL